MTTEICDLLGIGFGPAGIALAAAFEDWREQHPGDPGSRVEFLEARSNSSWHDSLLLPGTDLSHHFFRDLATPRNPRSRFTFTNFLWEKGRLFAFGQRQGPALRTEWSEYIEWAAKKLSDYVTYDAEVSEIEPEVVDGEVRLLRVHTSRGTWRTRDLVVGTGHRPRIPEEFRPFLGERFFHSSRFLPMLNKLERHEPLTFLVIGSGQSAAESLVYLHDEFKQATFHSIHRRIGFKQLDDSPFSQQVYFPEETDYFFDLSLPNRAQALEDIFLTNYSTVDRDISKALYDRVYEDKIRERERVFIHYRRLIKNIEERNGRYRFQLEDTYTGERLELEADVVVFCTGFYEPLVPELLEPLRSYLKIDEQGGTAVTRDYLTQTVDSFAPRIFLNGLCERTHGMSNATSFSMMALKAGDIFRSWSSASSRQVSAVHAEPETATTT